jgi:hypothetical protein
MNKFDKNKSYYLYYDIGLDNSYKKSDENILINRLNRESILQTRNGYNLLGGIDIMRNFIYKRITKKRSNPFYSPGENDYLLLYKSQILLNYIHIYSYNFFPLFCNRFIYLNFFSMNPYKKFNYDQLNFLYNNIQLKKAIIHPVSLDANLCNYHDGLDNIINSIILLLLIQIDYISTRSYFNCTFDSSDESELKNMNNVYNIKYLNPENFKNKLIKECGDFCLPELYSFIYKLKSDDQSSYTFMEKIQENKEVDNIFNLNTEETVEFYNFVIHVLKHKFYLSEYDFSKPDPNLIYRDFNSLLIRGSEVFNFHTNS